MNRLAFLGQACQSKTDVVSLCDHLGQLLDISHGRKHHPHCFLRILFLFFRQWFAGVSFSINPGDGLYDVGQVATLLIGLHSVDALAAGNGEHYSKHGCFLECCCVGSFLTGSTFGQRWFGNLECSVMKFDWVEMDSTRVSQQES